MGFLSLFFFGGLSMHLTTAILAHMFSYNITWGATKKVCDLCPNISQILC